MIAAPLFWRNNPRSQWAPAIFVISFSDFLRKIKSFAAFFHRWKSNFCDLISEFTVTLSQRVPTMYCSIYSFFQDKILIVFLYLRMRWKSSNDRNVDKEAMNRSVSRVFWLKNLEDHELHSTLMIRYQWQLKNTRYEWLQYSRKNRQWKYSHQTINPDIIWEEGRFIRPWVCDQERRCLCPSCCGGSVGRRSSWRDKNRQVPPTQKEVPHLNQAEMLIWSGRKVPPKGGTTSKSAAMLIWRGKNLIQLTDYIDY